MINPLWMEDEALQNGSVDFLLADEDLFWTELIKKYLKPLDLTEKETVIFYFIASA